MSTHTVPSIPSDGDEALAELVDELAARLQVGEPIDLEAIARAHPEYAERLGPLLPALQAMAGLAQPSTDSDHPQPTGVLGDFRIVREVGRGGMGVVYEAQQLSLGGRRVALKVLPFAGMFDPRYLLRFQNEARAAACLHHPHIVPVYAVGCDRGVHYYAMQFIDGLTLAAMIDGFQTEDQQTRLDTGSSHGAAAEPSEPLPRWDAATPVAATLSTERSANPREFLRTVARLGKQAASALDHAHQQGVIHRDVKPANLLLDGERNVWVTDFGLAHFREECGVTRTGEVIGTLRYMSPEQTHGRRMVDHRTDIYSLGVTLYELLTLRPAFRGDDRQDLLRRIATEDPPRASRHNAAIPAELETIVAKAMAKAPEERYSTAQELANDLQRWLDDQPILARPPGQLQKLRKWSRRHLPFVITLVASLLLLTAALVAGLVVYAVRQRELVDEKSRWAQEAEQAERRIAADYRRVLLGRAEAIRMSRLPGSRRRVWADLHEAITLPETEGDEAQLRSIVLGYLSDPIGLDPVENPAAIPRQVPIPVPAEIEKKLRRTSNGPIIAAATLNLFATVEQTRLIAFHDTEGNKTGGGFSPLGAIYDLAFTPSGKSIVAGCEQGFFVWGLPFNERWVVSSGNIFSVAVSPNGRFVAVGGQQLELWSLATSRLIVSLPSPAPGTRVEFSADGRTLLAVVHGKAVAGWAVSDTPERRVFDGHTLGVPAVAFKPDGSRLVSVSKDLTVQVWNTGTGRVLEPSIGHGAEIEAVAFSPDGARFATGDFRGTIQVWDAATRTVLANVTGAVPGQIWQLQFSSNGEYLVAAGARGVAVWKVRVTASGAVTLTGFRTLPAPGNQPTAIDLAIRPGSSEVVFLTPAGQLYSFDLNRTDEPRLLTTSVCGLLRTLHFDPKGNRLTVITSTGTFGYWDWRAKKITDTRRRAELSALSADGRWAAVRSPGQNITVIEMATGQEIYTLPSEGGDVWCLAWSADGTQLAASLSDGRVAIWNLEQVRARLAEFGIVVPSTAR